jgi:flavin reductase (DIM6/NTAB) family NADH-FMN oxidoreductase RutF
MNGAEPLADKAQTRSGEAGRSGSNAERFKLIMRNIASSVAVITVEHEGRKHGMTATAVCSVSAAPPTILIVVNRLARTHPIISEARRFTVNILAAHQVKLADRFSEKHPAPFDRICHRAGICGGPVLEDTAAYVECETQAEIQAGTHTIFVGTVMGGDATTLPPLLYHNGEYKSLFGGASGVEALLGKGEAAHEFEQAKQERK